MHLVAIEDDVYVYLVRNTQELGEDPSSILRRLLGLDRIDPARKSSQPAPNLALPEPHHELSACLEKSSWYPSVVDRFVYLLGCIYSQKGAAFSAVLKLQGQNRRYFAKSAREIENSGTATQPKKIPSSDYWVMTNSPTRQKARQLRQVMEVLGYGHQAMLSARQYLKHGKGALSR